MLSVTFCNTFSCFIFVYSQDFSNVTVKLYICNLNQLALRFDHGN